MDILEELKTLTAKLEQAGIEYALCGGLAMAVYALPRATLDIDIMIEPGLLDKAKGAIRELGFTIAAMPMEFHAGKIQIHRFSKIEPDSGETLALDLLLVTPGVRPAWDGRTTVQWEGGIIHVVSPEGLILLKSFRASGQDQDDIRYLESIVDEN